MGGFLFAPLGVAALARACSFKWPFILYGPAVLLSGLFASEFFVPLPTP
jgi:hypothetical protein